MIANRIEEVSGALAKGYTHPANQHKVLDADLIEAMTQEVMKTDEDGAKLLERIGVKLSIDDEFKSITIKVELLDGDIIHSKDYAITEAMVEQQEGDTMTINNPRQREEANANQS